MIAFRLDANQKVATGHMFRCMAIAKECQKMGKECIFFLAEGGYTEPLTAQGFAFEELELRWDDWDYGIKLLKTKLLEKNAECLVVDSYWVTEGFFCEMTELLPTFYLDDLCRTKYHLSAVLHYSEWEGEHQIADLYQGTKVKTYSGMQFMPLREGFFNIRTKEELKYDLLITTGGSDAFHVTKGLLEKILLDRQFSELSVCAVLGKMNPDADEIRTLCRGKKNISVMQNISNMNEVMRESRFAVTAGGTTVYELMASGTLFVCFSFSDDQMVFAKQLKEHGNCGYAGDARYDRDGVFLSVLEEIRKMQAMSEVERNLQIERNHKCIDGKGSRRIAEILAKLCERGNKNE